MSRTPAGEPAASGRLVVVGAASGMARWFGDHVLAPLPWTGVALLDASTAVTDVPGSYGAPTLRARVEQDGPSPADAAALRDMLATHEQVVAVVGVPIDRLASVAGWLRPTLPASATIVDLTPDRVRADAIWERVGGAAATPPVVGVHALFGMTVPSADGQTFVVCPSPVVPEAHRWVSAAIEGAGATVNELTAARHDEIMRIVQTAGHQALLMFADVVTQACRDGGLDLERDLWANRTPVFELLAGLTSRVLTPGQEVPSSTIQLADDGRVADAFAAANVRLRAAREDGVEGVGAYLAGLRDPFPGSLFQRVQQVGALATTTVQATRAEISRQRRTGELVGVRSLVGGDRVHVGTIVRSTPTSFVLTDVLVGRPGAAALLTDEVAIANARRLGIGGKARRVEFSLGRVRLLAPEELEAVLDGWLATIDRGVKVLVPDSISGESAARVIRGVEGVRDAALLSEEVRLGQRELVVRVTARVDRDLDVIERAIAHRVDEVFEWPEGVVLPLAAAARTIAYLGPAGTFSHTAARQLARLIGGRSPDCVEYTDFAAILAAVGDGGADLAVVPIANSSSGLVDLAAEALLSTPDGLVAGGVVDVLVRFDAYVNRGGGIHPGDHVYTHPQVIRQCSAFIEAHHLVAVPVASTVEACRLILERGEGIAIANVGMDGEDGLDLARAGVGNLTGAVTRFLVVARQGTFAAPPRRDATLRTVWLSGDAGAVVRSPVPRFDEVLVGPSGLAMVISTDESLAVDGAPRRLGTLPWSPRTPLVVVGDMVRTQADSAG